MIETRVMLRTGLETDIADPAILELGIPTLGICYGHQVMAHALDGVVAANDIAEYGRAELRTHGESLLFRELGGDAFLASRETVGAQLDDLALFLRDYRGRIESTPGRLDEVELRLAELERHRPARPGGEPLRRHEEPRQLRNAGRHHPRRRPPGDRIDHPRPRRGAPQGRADAALRGADLQRLLVQPRTRDAAGSDP